MYLLLLMFGGLLGAAGVVLAGSGMSLRDGTFDAPILTPGIVAAAGGLLLIGLGAGLRTLQRIDERWLLDRCHLRLRSQRARKLLRVSTHHASRRGFHSHRRQATNLSRASLHATFWETSRRRPRPVRTKHRHPFLQARSRLFMTRMPKPVDSGPAKAATVRRECRPGSAYRRICGVQVQANGKANRPSMRCGRKANVHRVPSKGPALRSPRTPA
jgi:hypothetical protein